MISLSFLLDSLVGAFRGGGEGDGEGETEGESGCCETCRGDDNGVLEPPVCAKPCVDPAFCWLPAVLLENGLGSVFCDSSATSAKLRPCCRPPAVILANGLGGTFAGPFAVSPRLSVCSFCRSAVSCLIFAILALHSRRPLGRIERISGKARGALINFRSRSPVVCVFLLAFSVYLFSYSRRPFFSRAPLSLPARELLVWPELEGEGEGG